MLQAIHGDPLMEVSCDMPDDVRLLHDLLPVTCHLSPVTCHLNNCGTAMRFLTAYFAQLEGCDVVLDGCERMYERPIGQEVDALRQCGAQIEYKGKEGFPPLHIVGTKLVAPKNGLRINNPLSTQMVSALLLIGLPVQTNSRSPYIAMTKRLIANYNLQPATCNLESDWSAAAFWYEYVALHGGEIEMNGLKKDSLQGDCVVADLFRPLGVDTLYTDAGVRITRTRRMSPMPMVVNFAHCPDLYPAVKMTCVQLCKPLIAIGTASLRLKESDRLAAFSTTSNLQPATSHHDHRIAMALLAADIPCDDTDCISKSYPLFVEQLTMQNAQCTIDFTTIVPKRGINDDNKGKKHALHKLISAATTEYVWLQDDDVTPAPCNLQPATCPLPKADLYILPLQMKGDNSLLSRLQIAEYAAIQEVTMRTAKRGRAVMCSGANLLVRRNSWLESYADIHPEIPSGDDMFLLESFRRKGFRILAVDKPEFTATISAVPTWREFLHQRMRWAGKAPHYTDSVIRRCGAVVLLVNLLQIVCPAIILIKFPIEYSLIKKRDQKVSFFTALLLELVYPFYILLSICGGILCIRNW